MLGPTLIDYPFAKDEAAWEAIAAGSQITVDSPLGAKTFPLTGTAKAIDTLMDCASEYFPESWLENPSAPADDPRTSLTEPSEPAAPSPATSADDPVAYALGIMLGDLEGTAEDAYKAVSKRADEGDRRALWLAGRMGLSGYGTDEARAVSLARILAAAEAGHPEALTFLALHYLASNDPIKALVKQDYLKRAIAQAHGPAIAAQALLQEDDWP